jgi:hypothetical protein
MRLARAELMALLRKIPCDLLYLAEGPIERPLA